MKRIAMLWLICMIAGSSCKKATTQYVPLTGQTIDLLSIIKVNFNFSLFYHALQVTHLDSVFMDSSEYTILLPDNIAFSNIGIAADADLDKMSSDSLRLWMKLHILPGAVPSGDIPQTINAVYTCIGGQDLYLTNNGMTIRADGDTLVSVDTKATNGYIHVLNKPLALPWPSVKTFLQSDPDYSIFAAACGRFGLLAQLDSGGPYTLLAPLNSAFLGEGISLDSVNRMDPARFKPYLFGSSIFSGVRIYTADFGDPRFIPAQAYPYQLPPSFLAFIYPDYVVFNTSSGPPFEWEVIDPHRSALDPNWGGQPVFLGPNDQAQVGINQRGASIADPDHHCVNGVVHGLNDILIYPDSVSIQ